MGSELRPWAQPTLVICHFLLEHSTRGLIASRNLGVSIQNAAKINVIVFHV